MSSSKALSQLCHSVGMMLESGVDIQQSLTVAGRQCRNRRLSEAILRCESEVGAGSSLSEAMGKEQCLPPLLANMVQVGEETGHLDTVFAELADFLELKARLWRRFLGKITMPAVQYVAAVFVLSLARYIIAMVQDEPAGLFRPLAAGYGIPAGIIVSLWVLTRRSGGSRWVHELLWRIPLLWRVARPLALARFSLCFKFTLETGMHIKDALRTAFGASGNPAFQARAPVAGAAVAGGESLTAALEKTGLFDDEYIAVVGVAEESGSVMERMQWLARHYGERAEEALSVLASACAILIWIMVAGFMIFFIFRMYFAYFAQIGRFV